MKKGPCVIQNQVRTADTCAQRIVSRFRDKRYRLFRYSRRKNVNKQRKKLPKKERKSKLYNFLQIEEKCGVVSV
jgi:hypothetical protein